MKSAKKKKTVSETTRLKRVSKRAIIAASDKAMELVGYVVKVENGWVVKKTASGRVMRLKKLSPKVRPKEVILD